MKFRPCIDIHNGKVKQIVGGSLCDAGDAAAENFASDRDAAYYARLYRKDGLKGGHVICLNPAGSAYYEETRTQALSALSAYPGGLQIGGGITPENAKSFLDAGASHVIVTSYVFREGKICYDRLEAMVEAVGRDRLILDLSCRLKDDGSYYVVTDRWQTFTDVQVTENLLQKLENSCAEFLIHGVDVEGKASGVEEGLVKIIARYAGARLNDDPVSKTAPEEQERIPNPVTYAGGIGSMEDLKRFGEISQGVLDYTIGSALDLFGGTIPYNMIVESERISWYN